MLMKPDLVRDVAISERKYELSCFIENRHDQTLLSALIYRYLGSGCGGFIADRWEHVENQSLFRSQAIRAMRWNSSLPVTWKRRVKEIVLRVGKDMLLKPVYVVKMAIANIMQ